ncbi:hypothetical protein H112_08470 [Trichophyton rubrum D6]|nr:uncharacterized protein TERG_01034 [Trichophyton rubrum CBS 118892]EZF10277.1 hypothetical protein H100_08492 [Trichophyton rubrum MR850]EZF37168.1 hypothetical protein H102_08451 [Trichophyton rubrum CBS 100081]EZF47731.1 hypothetical protein H103_08474 [Trichophyton rubrum CBS 288.86]EZF58521.1 hypothetical protein H104_08427 [Trichophyton rubrum CBS 289.86]EZF68927.1 hypothetical protein H105_08480 [Trichophyton soudanense CBS 452.61]EZF79649.1 hypothetical protein H110_08477 [Trichophy
MAEKRKLSPSDGSPSTKRIRPAITIEDNTSEDESPSRPQYQQPRSDPVFGQRHAFPGLDDVSQDGELFYGPADDGIEYLRMVRSEARNLPVFFVAKGKLDPQIKKDSRHPTSADASSIGTPQETEQTWIYSDGVCAAVSNTVPENQLEAGNSEPEDPQEQYYNLLRHRFLLLRSTLKCVPPAKLIAALDNSHPISLPADNPRARTEWTTLVKTVEPQMVQLACMDLDSVLRVLRIVTRSLSEAAKSPSCSWTTRIAAWAWGLLGRCRDVGEMSSEEVGELRDLGKRAGKILSKIREKESQAMLSSGVEGNSIADRQNSDWDDGDEAEDMQEETGEDNTVQEPKDGSFRDETKDMSAGAEDESEALELAKKRLQGMLSGSYAEVPESEQAAPSTANDLDSNKGHQLLKSEWKYNARAMLDMILTIVGEFYGQRDLLELRDIWDEVEG